MLIQKILITPPPPPMEEIGGGGVEAGGLPKNWKEKSSSVNLKIYIK